MKWPWPFRRADGPEFLTRRPRLHGALVNLPPVDITDAPSTARVTLHDGTEVPCTIERTGPREWVARSARPVDEDDVKSLFVDRFPAYSTVLFDGYGPDPEGDA